MIKNIGMIGFGFIGKVHAQAYHAIPFCFPQSPYQPRVSAVLRRHPQKDHNFLRSIGDPFVTDDMDAFLKQDLDLIDVCTPNVFHLEQISAAAAKQVPIYCEKPLGINLAHARKITEITNQAHIPTHTAFTMRYYPAVRQAKAILAAGVLGEIYHFRAHLYHNSYMDAKRPISWRLKKEVAGGGALADLGIHMIDMILYLLGSIGWVQCQTRTLIKNRPAEKGSMEEIVVDVDDWGVILLGLENGAKGYIEATRMSGGAGDSTRVEIFGSLGSICIDMDNPDHVQYYDHTGKLHQQGELDFPTPANEHAIESIYPPKKMSLGPFVNIHLASIIDFLQYLHTDIPSPINFESALRAQEILEASYRSANTEGTMMHIPLQF